MVVSRSDTSSEMHGKGEGRGGPGAFPQFSKPLFLVRGPWDV